MKQQWSEIAFHYKNISTAYTETKNRNPMDLHILHPPLNSYTFHSNISFHMNTGNGNHVIPYTDVKRSGLVPRLKEVGANATVRRMGKASCTVISHHPWQILCGLNIATKYKWGWTEVEWYTSIRNYCIYYKIMSDTNWKPLLFHETIANLVLTAVKPMCRVRPKW